MIAWSRFAALLRHELRVIVRDPVPLAVLVVFPLITMAFLEPAFEPALANAGYRNASGAQQVVPGQATMSAFFVVSLVTYSFFSEHAWGTWDRLRASPATSLEIVLAKTLPRLAMVLLQFCLVFAVGALAFDLVVQGSTPALAPLVLAFATCLGALGVAITALARSAQQAQAVAIVGMVIFGAIGGAFVPFDVLPGWAQTIAPITPTYWAMDGFEAIILDGAALDTIAVNITVLLGIAATATAVALLRFRFDEHKTGWA